MKFFSKSSKLFRQLQLSLGKAAVPLPGCRGAHGDETSVVQAQLNLSTVCVWGKLQEHSAFHPPLLLLMIAQSHAPELRAQYPPALAICNQNSASPILAPGVSGSFKQSCHNDLSWADILPRQACLSLDRHLHSSHQDKGFLTSKNSKHTLS